MSNLELPRRQRVSEASKRYGVGKSTLFRWVSQGRLTVVKPSPRITLLSTDELEELFNGGAK